MPLLQKLRVRNFVAQTKLLRPEEFEPPISFRPVVGAVLLWGEEEMRELAMLIVRYNIINGIVDSGPSFASAPAGWVRSIAA